MISSPPFDAMRFTVCGIRANKDFNWRSACPFAQVSRTRPDASITEITDAAKYSPVSKVLVKDKTAKTSDPMLLLRISATNQVIAGIKPKIPDAIQKGSEVKPRAKVVNEARSSRFIALRSLITLGYFLILLR